MSTSVPRRIIRVFPDIGVGPLWENDHPNYAMEPNDYGLSDDLAEALRNWNDRWKPTIPRRSREAREWLREGRSLADRVAETVREYADVVYEA